MKFTYNGMEVECTVEEFMKIAASGGGEAKDPVEVIGKLTEPVSLSLDPVELDKEVIDKLCGMDEYHADGLPSCSSCCLCKVYCDATEDRLCEDKDENPCPNYYEAGCAYRNGVLTKDLTEKLIFGEDETEKDDNYAPCTKCHLCDTYSALTCEDDDGVTCPNYSEYGCAYQTGILDKWKEYNDLVKEFKKDPRYLEKEESWPYDEAKCTLESIMETEYLLTVVGLIIQRTNDPGYEHGAVVVICPGIDGAYQVYDDAGYVMAVDDLVGFIRKAYHADIRIYSPLEVVDDDFAQEIEDACTIIAEEETEKLLKQR